MFEYLRNPKHKRSDVVARGSLNRLDGEGCVIQ